MAIGAKVLDILRVHSNTTILTTKKENEVFANIIGNSMSNLNYRLFSAYGEAFNNLDPTEVLNVSDWNNVSEMIDLMYRTTAHVNGIKSFENINQLSPDIQNLMVTNSLNVIFISHFKALVGNNWPQSRVEWEAFMNIMGQSMLELGLAFVPGSGIIDAVSSVNQDDYTMAAFALATVMADFFGGTIIKGVAKVGKVAYKAFKIFRLAYDFLSSLTNVIQKGFKVSLNTFGSLKLINKKKNVIAQGDDVGKYVRVVNGATDFLTNQTAINNFSDEIININRQFSDGVLLNGAPSSAINTALYQGTVVDQAASIFKSISRNHMFTNGNKRTAVEMFKSFASKSSIPVNLTDNQLLDIATQVATGALDNVSQIAAALIK